MSHKIILGFAALLVPGVALADWTRSYVIEWNEPAMYYGAEGGVIDPGSDCPQGTNPELDWIQVLMKAGYTREEAEWLRDPANPTRSPVHGQNQMAFRGKDRANVYTNPESYPDPGLAEVSGKVAEGINLDGDKTTGFVSPDGEKGIDNTFYKTLGCWKTYRGPERLSSGALQFNDSMRNGGWTTVIVMHGRGDDPMNDDQVDVGFYMSDNDMVKGGDGNIARDYTFRIAPHAHYEAIFKARTVDGMIISTEPADTVMLRDPGYTRDLELRQAQVQLQMREDGSLRGYVGGYRPWRPVYDGWVNARGPVIESLTWVELPSVYYALKRNADYSPEGANGEKTHISFALRVDALPAYVMTPDYRQQAAAIKSYKALAPEQKRERQFSYTVDGVVPYNDPNLKAGPDLDVLLSKQQHLSKK
ncbi:MAG: hypothetical protein WDZ30_07630 [Cellvibrionaceae bacterium]